MRLKSKLLYAFLASIIAMMAVASYLNSATETQQGTSGPKALREEVSPRPAPQFTLTDHNGARRSLADWRGRVILVGFIYTSCPDVCPLIATQLLKVQERFSDYIPDELVIVLITLDPEHDTPEVLAKWTRAWRGRWFAMTGSVEECRAVWRSFGVSVYREAGGAAIIHTAKTVIIDREGLVRVNYYGIPRAEQLIDDIARLL